MFHLSALCASWTNYLVDIIVVLALIGFAFICARKGFIECFFSFISSFGALLVAFLLAKPLLLATGGLFGLEGVFQTSFENAFLGIEGFDLDVSNSGLETALAEKNLPKFLIDLIVDNFGNADLAANTTLASVVGGTLANVAMLLIAFIVLFVVAKVVFFILRKTLSALADHIALLDAVNTILGLVLGLLQALLLIYGVLAILAIIPAEAITAYFENSLFVGFLYNHNLLNIIFGWMVG